MERSQRQVLVTACFAHGLIHVFELCVPPLLLLIQAEFHAGDLRMGQIVTLYGMLFGVGALPAGLLVDRFGSRRLLLLCLWGASVSMLGMALSPSLGSFALCAAVMGFCLSIYHPAGTAWITHSIPVSGRVFALHGMAGNLGVAGASAIAGLLGAAFGWRWAVAVLAVAGGVVGVGVARLPSPALHEIRAGKGTGRWTDFALLLFAITFLGMVYRGMTTFLPKVFATSFSSDPATGTAVGGLLTTLALLVGLVGMYTAGRVVDAGVHPSRVFLAGAVFQAPFLAILAYATPAWLLPLVMAVAFFHFLTQPPGNQMVAMFTPARLRGLGYGLYFFLSFGAGAVGATVAGWVSERHGLLAIFGAMAVILVPSMASTAILAMRSRA